jgi:hypothetical protein
MASITTSPVPGAAAAVPGTRATTFPGARRGWARAGVAAGVLGLVAFLTSGALTSVPDTALADNADYLRRIADKGVYVWAFLALMSGAALGLVLFGAGLRRRLDEQEPVGSLVPTAAFGGLVVAAVLCLVGGGISTELFWQLQSANDDIGSVDPDTVAANLGIFNTMGWAWAGVGLTAGAVAWAGLRHESVGRKLAWFSAVMAGLIGLLQLVPLQYLAALPAALWCVVTGVALSRRSAAS